MPFKNILILSLKSLYRAKSKNLLYLALISFCIFFLSIAYNLASAYYFSIDRNLNIVPEYRSFALEINNQEANKSLGEWVSELKQYGSITEAYEYFGPIDVGLEREGFKSNILLNAGDSLHIPKITLGRGFSEHEEEVAAIVPSRLIIQDSDGFKEIETKEYIGETLTVTYPSIENIQSYLELKVIGIYQAKADSEENRFYIPLSNYYMLVKSQSAGIENKGPEVKSNYSLIVVIDDYRNFDPTVQALNKNSAFSVILSEDNMLDTNLIAAIKAISLIMFLIIIIITFFTIRVVIDASIHDRSREIALFKAIGYNNRHIFYMIFTEAIILSSISCIVALIFSKIAIT